MRRIRRPFPVLLALVAGLLSCKGGERILYPPPTIALSIDRATLSMIPGGRDSTRAIITRGGSYAGVVTIAIEGLPSGVSAAVTPAASISEPTKVVLVATTSAAPGSYSATIRATGSGVSEATTTMSVVVQPTPVVTLSATPGTITLNQGASGAVQLALTRTNFIGSVTITSSNVPSGVTVTVDPSATATNAATVTVVTTAQAAVGSTIITLRASSAGIADATTTFTLTVAPAPAFTLALTPSALTIEQGRTAAAQVSLTRTNFTSAVNFTLTGVPSGVTATITPPSTTGTTAQVDFAVGSAAPAGVYTIGIRAAAAPLTDRAAELTLTIRPVVLATIDFSACAATDRATWLALQNSDGAWTRITGTNDVYTLRMTEPRVTYAYQVQTASAVTVRVQHATSAELAGAVVRPCAAPSPATISMSGSVVNPEDRSAVFFGSARALVPQEGTFSIAGVRLGTFDLWAYTGGERGFVVRGLNPGAGGSLGVIDFKGPSSFSALSANGRVGGASVGESVQALEGYLSGTGATACTSLQLTPLPISAGDMDMYGVPTSRQLPTDFHQLYLQGTFAGTTNTRAVTESFAALLTRVAQPFLLPTAQTAPTVTIASGATNYKRLQAVVSGIANEYNRDITMTITGGTAPARTLVQSATPAWRIGTGITLITPDFAGVDGWTDTWAPIGSGAAAWALELAGSNGPLCQEGSRQVNSTFRGSR